MLRIVVQWHSSDSSVAAVDEKGVVTGVAVGRATITAVHRDGLTATFAIEVKPQATAMVLNVPDAVLVPEGEFARIDLNVAFEPANAMQEDVKWISSCENVVVVDENGVLTAKEAGLATIIVQSANGLQVNCGVEVKEQLTVLALPHGLKVIAEEAFAGTDGVEAIIVPEAATAIGARAFADCTNLRFVILPDGLKNIAADAFSGSTRLSILCNEDSSAAEYAGENGIAWIDPSK